MPAALARDDASPGSTGQGFDAGLPRRFELTGREPLPGSERPYAVRRRGA